MTTERELQELQRLAANKTVLELGSWQGRSTLALAETARIVHAVDWFHGDPHVGQGDSLPVYLAATRHLPNVVTHIGRFTEVLPHLALGGFDLVFFDGYHTHHQVADDIRLALPLVAPLGTLAFHDYGVTQGDFGVTQAVNERFPNIQVTDTLAVVKLDARTQRRAA